MRSLLSVLVPSLLLLVTSDAFAEGCGFMIGSSGSLNVAPELNITPAAAGTQALLPNQNDLFPSTMSYPVSYWSRNQGNVSKTIIFDPKLSEFTADPNNPKGWLVDSTVPGLYFTLSVNLPNPTSNKWGSFSPAMPIWLSNDTTINQSAPQTGWGCASDRNDTHTEDTNMTFSLNFYTTADFDPAKAAGKQLLASRKRAGTIDNTKQSGGEFDIFLQGPITIASASCAAFNADDNIDLGELYASDLRANPSGEFNKTPFQITLSNCYAQPDLIVNLSTNQVKNNLLVNTNGKAAGIGVGLGYTAGTTNERLDMTQAVTIDSNNLHYTGDNGNGTLDMYAFLSATDGKSAITAGSVDISAVITLSHP
ncbi:TPA: hypothetical protein JDD71_003004 [Salmonella enterica subsp. salamae]|nr:hypothetical protein [Salmonella enterica]HAU3146490.1 hypothetical protein [Salmonella enterica subsp. salamae]